MILFRVNFLDINDKRKKFKKNFLFQDIIFISIFMKSNLLQLIISNMHQKKKSKFFSNPDRWIYNL